MNYLNWKLIPVILVILVTLLIIFGYHGDIPYEDIKSEYRQVESQWVNVDGSDLHYVDLGKGPGIFIIHGSGAELGAFKPLTLELSQLGYRTVAIDLPGSGLSTASSDYGFTRDEEIILISKFLKIVDMTPFAIIGHSTGGQLAWTATLKLPELTKRLILISPTGFPIESPFAWQMANFPMLGTVMTKITPEILVRMSLEDVFHDDELITDDLVKRYHRMILREGGRQAMLSRMRLVSYDHHDKLHCSAQETLLIWGEEDYWLPVELGKRFESKIPNATLLTMADVGHNVPEEVDAKEFADVIDNWLKTGQEKDSTATLPTNCTI